MSDHEDVKPNNNGIKSKAAPNTLPYPFDNCFKGVLGGPLTIDDIGEAGFLYPIKDLRHLLHCSTLVPLRTEFVTKPKASRRLDSLYRINFLPGKKLPPGLSRKDEVYLFVEYEEKFRAGNIGKLLNYVGIVTEEYFTNLRKNFIINSVVIYGPKIKPPKTFKSNDDISEHKTISLSPYPVKINFINIYLSKINQEKVFAKIKDKIDQGKKLNNFNLFELLTLPRIGKFDIDLLTKCFHVATDPAINSKDGIERFKYYFDILFFDSLNNDQKKIFKKELVMSQYFQKMHEEYAKEAVQRAEQEFQAKKEVEMQELQAKHRAEMQALQRAKEKAEQELQAKHRAEMQALQRAKEKAEQRAKKEAEQRAKEKAKKPSRGPRS